MSEYKGYKVGDIIYYTDEYDLAIGVITEITILNITIDWVWAEFGGLGIDNFELSDFDGFEPDFKKITEQEKLALLMKLS
jgi:hypothetical protein